MNDLPEHVRGHVEGLSDLDGQIDAVNDHLHALRVQRQNLIDSIAQKAAQHQIGEEYDTRSGARLRITKIKGDYFYEPELMSEPIVWVRYRGVRLFKKGTEGREETLYPPERLNGSSKPV